MQQKRLFHSPPAGHHQQQLPYNTFHSSLGFSNPSFPSRPAYITPAAAVTLSTCCTTVFQRTTRAAPFQLVTHHIFRALRLTKPIIIIVRVLSAAWRAFSGSNLRLDFSLPFFALSLGVLRLSRSRIEWLWGSAARTPFDGIFENINFECWKNGGWKISDVN